MSKEVVKYHNDMNTVSFKNFNGVELDIFFAICYRMKEKQTEEIEMTFSEIRTIAKLEKRYTTNEFYRLLKKMYSKLLTLEFSSEKGATGKRIFEQFILFRGYKIIEEEQIVIIKVNEDFTYILNNFTKNFTRFEFEQFVSLKSSYSKNLFKLLAQYNATGMFIIKLEDFRYLLDIPRSYQTKDINKFIINQSLKELSSHFTSLTVEKIKKGRAIEKFKFSWKNKQIKRKKIGNKIVKFDLTGESVEKFRQEKAKEFEENKESWEENMKKLEEVLKKK